MASNIFKFGKCLEDKVSNGLLDCDTNRVEIYDLAKSYGVNAEIADDIRCSVKMADRLRSEYGRSYDFDGELRAIERSLGIVETPSDDTERGIPDALALPAFIVLSILGAIVGTVAGIVCWFLSPLKGLFASLAGVAQRTLGPMTRLLAPVVDGVRQFLVPLGRRLKTLLTTSSLQILSQRESALFLILVVTAVIGFVLSRQDTGG